MQTKFRFFKKPMPFFIGGLVDYNHVYSINWSDSYDFQNQKLTYSLWLSDGPDFSNILLSKEGIEGTELIMDDLDPGIYYVKMRVVDEDGNSVKMPVTFYSEIN